MTPEKYLKLIENCERSGLEFLLASWRETRHHVDKITKTFAPEIEDTRAAVEEVITGLEKMLADKNLTK